MRATVGAQHTRPCHLGPRPLQQHLHLHRPTHRHHVAVRASTSVPASATQYKPIPVVRGGLPWLGVLHKCPVDELFLFMEREFAELGGRCLDLPYCGEHAIYLRHPEDISRALRNSNTWTKTKNWQRLNRWLGTGLVSELDPVRHAAARDVLAPAFRAQSVKDFVPLFADVAGQLAALLLSRQGREVELEPLTRRATLDVIGRAGFGYDFRALHTLAQQQQLPSSSSSASSDLQQQQQGVPDVEQYIDVVKVFDDVLSPAMMLVCNLPPRPLPDFLLSGYQGYVRGIQQLEVVVQHVMRERREHGIAKTDRSLLSFMLAAQQADPTGIVTDAHIRDQLMVFMLAGSDTTASTLAFCLHELAKRPHVLAEVQQELAEVLGDTPTDQLKPESFMSLPFLTGCINESLRLYPAAPGLSRTLTQDEVCGEHRLSAGTIVVLDFFSCHRHSDFWPRSNEWLPARWLPANLKTLGPKHPDAFVPFSAGSRSCIGRYFAMLEMQVILAVLLRGVIVRAGPGREQHEPRLVQSFTLSSKDGLFLVPEAR